ncbi:cohesin domain-containing protein [Patescibacteria group bacterium]
MKGVLKVLLTIILFAIGSWVVIHISALFGVFIAFAYPIWQFILPGKIPCLFCTIREEGEMCPACDRVVSEATGKDPDSLKSIAYNSVAILLLSLISIGIVYGEQRLLKLAGFPPTPKTVSFIIPSKNQYKLGEIFPMKVHITGIQTPINAVQADIGFNPDILEVASISTIESFANVFIQKEIDNENGFARLTGGLPNPGYFSDHGDFGTVYFKGIQPGVSKVEFLPTSLVLANDGKGTNVIKEYASTSFLILPDEIETDIREQQEVLIGADVLGEQTESTQMIFYEEPVVLGIKEDFDKSVPQELREIPCPKLGFCVIEFIDKTIISFWESVLGIVFNPNK